MAVSSIIKDKVAMRDLSGIRDAVFMAAMKDPGFSQSGAVSELLEFCFSNGISRAELFQPDDGRDIPVEVSNETLAKICASLRTNFSERKLEAAQKMGRMLYPMSKPVVSDSVPLRERSSASPKKVLSAISVAALFVLLVTMLIKCFGKSTPPVTSEENAASNSQTKEEGGSHGNGAMLPEIQK